MAAAPLDVLICGAGIAGATLACLLGRAGHRVVVVERDQGVRSSGAPVDVRGPAYGVVERLGLLPRLAELATAVRRVAFVDAAGRTVAELRTRRDPDRELEIQRGDLSAALVDAARSSAELRFDDSVTAARPDEHGVQVTLSSGGARRFDLAVGADGLHSTFRRLAFGPETEFVTPLAIHIATVRLGEPMDRTDTVVIHNEPGAAIALHPVTGTPGAAFLFRSADGVDPRDPAATTALLTRVYGGSGWRGPELLAAYRAAPDTYFDTVSRVRLPVWSQGHATLLGDAASAISLFGEGSSAAVLGAAVLADSLRRFPRDVSAALARYEATHRPITERWQRGAPVAARLLIPATRRGIALRNGALRLASRVRPVERVSR